MKKFAALVAPALLTSFSAMGGTPTTGMEITYPENRNDVHVKLKVSQICGTYPAYISIYKPEGKELAATFTVIGKKCGTNDIPKNKTFEFNINITREAVAANMQTLHPKLRINPVILQLN